MPPRGLIGRRPSTDSNVETWVSGAGLARNGDDGAAPDPYAARLSVDVSRELRSRIKIAAFKRGSTVANLLRHLLQREFGEDTECR